MVSVGKKEVRVTFYELVDRDSESRVAARDWNSILNNLETFRNDELIGFSQKIVSSPLISGDELIDVRESLEDSIVDYSDSGDISLFVPKLEYGDEKEFKDAVNSVVDEVKEQYDSKIVANFLSIEDDIFSPKAIEYAGRTLDGIVDGSLDKACLSLAIDRAISPRERKAVGGRRRKLHTSGKSWDPAEESVYVFFDRNIFGMVSSSIGAPTHSALCAWLDVYVPIDPGDKEKRWKAKPVVRKGVYEAVVKKRNMQVTGMSFAFKPENAGESSPGIINILSKHFSDTTEGLRVEIKVSAGRQKEKEVNSGKIVSDLEEVLGAGIGDKARVKAKEGGGRAREFDLIEDNLAYRVELNSETLNDADTLSSITNEEIRTGYDKMSELLLGAVPEVEE